MPLRASYILLNYNTAELSLSVLDSLVQHTPDIDRHQIIVVDNASGSGDLTKLKKGLAERGALKVELVCSRINGGFGAGHMLGVQQADGDVYYFLNSDIEFVMDITAPTLEFLWQHPDVGMVGGQILNAAGQLEMSFFNPFSWGSEILGDAIMSKLSPENYISRSAVYTEPTLVGSVVGALMIVRATDFDEIGGFDPHLFLYYEEKDLGLRLSKERSQNAYFLPQLEYIHLGSKSTESSVAVAVEFKLSRLYMTRKHLGKLGYWFLLLRSILPTTIKAIYSPKYRALFKLYASGGALCGSIRNTQALTPPRSNTYN